MAWNNVHQPWLMRRLERRVTRMAKATPRFAPRCAPTKSAATVTGWTLGRGCITTRRAVIANTIVMSIAAVIRLARGAERRKAKAVLTKAMSKSIEANGVSSGPCTPNAWNIPPPTGRPALRLATPKQGSNARRGLIRWQRHQSHSCHVLH